VTFTLLDDKKSNFANTAMLRAEKDVFRNWSDRWLNVCDALEKCFQIQNRRLAQKDGNLSIKPSTPDKETVS
jgi:hypothetical protein